MVDQSARQPLGEIPKPGEPLPEGTTWRYACDFAGCHVVTQGGLGSYLEHRRFVHGEKTPPEHLTTLDTRA